MLLSVSLTPKVSLFQGESPGGWSEINAFLLSDDAGLTWRATQPFGIYGAEGEVAELFDPPGRLMG